MQPLQVDSKVLMQQVVVHRDGGKPAHDAVAHQEAQGAHGKGEREHEARNRQAEQWTAHHLRGLHGNLSGRVRLCADDAEHPVERDAEHKRRRALPEPLAAAFRRVQLRQAHIQDGRAHAHCVNIKEIRQLIDNHVVLVQPP